MPKKTYTQINSVTLAAASSSVTFSSIPNTFRDLVLVLNGQLASNNSVGLRLNSDSGTNYTIVMMRNNTTTGTESGVETAATSVYANWSQGRSGDRMLTTYQVMDYSATDKHKTVLSRNNYTDITPTGRVEALASRWTNTAAVTSLTVITGTNALAAGFTAALYGIEA